MRSDIPSGSPSVPAVRSLIRVPMTYQAKDYTCGLAALQSVLFYYGEEFREEELAEKLGPTPEYGTKYPRMIEFAKSLNFRVEARTGMNLEDLRRLLDEQKPVILLLQAWADSPVNYAEDWEDGHYAVAVGYDHLNIYFMDPSILGNYAFVPVGEFLDRWHDKDGDTILSRFGMVIIKDRPGRAYKPDEIKKMR